MSIRPQEAIQRTYIQYTGIGKLRQHGKDTKTDDSFKRNNTKNLNEDDTTQKQKNYNEDKIPTGRNKQEH